MIVYGDATRVAGTRELLVRVTLQHDDAVARLLDVGELAQGLVDARFRDRGLDHEGPLAQLLARMLRAAAAPLAGRRGEPLAPLAAALARRRLPATVRVTAPEGYVHYAVFPERYAEAGAAWARRGGVAGERTVIGLRTIGATLGAVVAEASGATVFTTLRPTGHPFAREINASPRAHERLRDPRRVYAIVDEGPGLSGSSFGAVADWLEDGGVAPERIAFVPSHDGELGPHASSRHRARWETARRHVAGFDADWMRRALGLPKSAADVSGGRWRADAFARRDDWPAVHPSRERVKFLVEEHGERWLYKFAGFGRYGADKLTRARAQHDSGLAPETTELRRGFLRMRWVEGERPWPPAPRGSALGDALLHALTRHLAFVARSSPGAHARRGATPSELFAMMRTNVGEALGPDARADVEAFAHEANALDAAARPVMTDNRMQPWEWLVTRDGRVLKCDGVDHATGHDLVGPQDVAWDVAGAFVELGLRAREKAWVISRLGSEARSLERKLPFYFVAYLAFRAGELALAAPELAHDAEESARVAAANDRVLTLLARALRDGAAHAVWS